MMILWGHVAGGVAEKVSVVDAAGVAIAAGLNEYTGLYFFRRTAVSCFRGRAEGCLPPWPGVRFVLLERALLFSRVSSEERNLTRLYQVHCTVHGRNRTRFAVSLKKTRKRYVLVLKIFIVMLTHT